jgi:NADH:ubiquinone oxidoreductase subunit E
MMKIDWKSATRAAGAIVGACIIVLLVDFGVAANLAPKDDKLIKDLQKITKTDPSYSPKLAAEQKRVTNRRLARKKRDNIAAWVLTASAALFLTGAKRLAGNPSAPKAPQTIPTGLEHGGSPARMPGAAQAPPELDLAFVDRLVEQLGRGKEQAIPLLQAIQTHYRYLPDEALRRICEITDIKPAEIAGTSTFYGQFRRSPVGEHVVRVCHGTACHVSGARNITDELRRFLQIPEGSDTDPSRQFTLDEVVCLGCCSLAPVLMVDEQTTGKLTPSTACGALKAFEKETA